jgi:hypothetical protein
MRKIVLSLLAVAVFFVGCNKDKETEQNPSEASFEFKIEQTDNGFKNDVPECSDLNMDYVKFTISGETYKTLIYYVGGEYLTQVVKLPVGDYALTSFLVYNDNGTPDNEDDDILIKASPEPNSTYWDLMANPLDLPFSVDPFYKKQITVDVLCFEDLFYEEFGFTWFNFNDVKIERQCFFGDICTGCYEDYAGSLYEDQPEGIQMDMPAIFEIRMFKNDEDVPFRVFSNESYLGVGQCLEVYWPNVVDVEEEFTFELWVLLPTGNSFEYRHINSWTFMDDDAPATGDDGVTDFILGSCNYDGADYEFPMWINLPESEFTVSTGNTNPGTMGTYFDITLSGIGEGFDIENQTYGVWCGDKDETIYLGQSYTMVAISSLSTVLPDNLTLTRDQINQMNFFYNNITDVIPDFDYNNPSAHWSDVQNTFWAIAGDIVPSGPAADYYAYVMENSDGYEVPPGGYAAIIFWDNPSIQLVFAVVDPC